MKKFLVVATLTIALSSAWVLHRLYQPIPQLQVHLHQPPVPTINTTPQAFPYSVVMGGVHSSQEAQHATEDPVVKRHYANIWRLKAHDLTPDEYTQLLVLQNNQCAICHRKFDTEKPSHIDHSHKTGKTRGLLCGACNRAIGLLQDDPDVCKNAAAYLTGTKYACG